jgi:spoIIIJ-associated protein
MEVVTGILRGTGAAVSATLRSAHDPQVGGPVIDIQGEDSGLLIGRRGETMRALQFLVNLIVNKKTDESIRVMVDVESYRARREKVISDMALKVAERVISSGRTIALEPMSPAERRVVHLTLANNSRVHTESVGSGTSRKVTIIPKRG